MIQQDITQNNEQEPYIWRYLPEYEVKAMGELISWQEKMQRPPSLGNRISKGLQHRINRLIPEKVHQAITVVIRQMVRSILFGSEFTNPKPTQEGSLRQREIKVLKRIDLYNRLAATEGGITGAGGFLMSMADFPLFLSLKMKMLYEIAALYGHDVRDYRERLYLLRVFQLAFSSQQMRNEIYQQIQDWESQSQLLPYDVNAFDWRSFQLEYRDYLDLAKLAQMLPGIGAAVGIVVNYRMTRQLGKTAMNAYRMRWAARNRQQQTSPH
ncbi:MAG: EcsC family protein [Cyclobacteriaceae bacterium]